MTVLSWRVAITSFVTSVGTLLMFWKYLPPEVPLWYGRPWGQDMLTAKLGLWWIPLIILCLHILGINLSHLLRSDKLLVGLILATTSVSSLVCALALLRIISIIV